MPIYEYRCGACGFQKEFLQRISDAQLTDCPECGKQSLSKMVTAAGFQLKGSGWYATDFKNNGVAKPGGAKSGGTRQTESKSTDNKSTETKSTENKQSESKSDDAPKKEGSKAEATGGAGITSV